ncbi:MAG: PA14 domain-containing protein, partial [Anaerolineae bacterium]
QYAWVHRDEFFARTKQASVFTGKTREQAVAALQSNIRKHLLMFNYQGDRNGRHNLPGEPMLDAVTGVLLPLGAAFVLTRLHRPRQLLIAGWFGIMLCGGILSLDFEAPQSLRSIGTIPAVFLMTALAVLASVSGLLAPLRRLGQPLVERVAGTLLTVGVVAGLAYSAYLNFDVYFVRQPRHPEVFHSYNAREAFTARKVAAEGDRYIFYSIYVGHPTVRFLAPDAPYHRSFQPLDDLPVRGLVDRDVIYVMEPEFCPPPELFAAWYPNGQIRWYNDPSGAPMLFLYQVSKDEVNGMQGVWFRLTAGDSPVTVVREERLDTLATRWDEWHVDAPARGEWSGQLFVPYSGMYTLFLRSTGTASLMLDDRPIQLPDGGEISETRLLVKGWHPVRLVAEATAGGEVSVEWAMPNGQRQPIPRESLNVLSGLPHGLYGYYYQGLEWSGVPAFGRVDWQVNFRWHIEPLSTPFSVEWYGGLKIDQAGSYLIAIDSNSDALVELNGQVILDSMRPPHGYRGVNLYLEPGVYPIHVRYREPGGYTMMRLQWHPPGGQFEAIPAEHLVPKVPEEALPAFSVAEPAPSPLVETPPAVAMEDVEEVPAKLLAAWPASRWLVEPRHIAVGPKGDVFVSDAGKKAVAVFDAGGRFRTWWGEGLLQDPSDLATAPDGSLYVIDAGRSRLAHFDARGKMVEELGGGAGLYGSRGLAWTPAGELAIADTGSNRVVIMSHTGEVLRSFGVQGAGIGQLDQPAELTAAPDGSIFVADTLRNKRLQVFSGEGVVLRQWAVPWANDFLSPAMAISPQGRLYMADPDRGRVWEYALDGSLVVWWAGGDMRRPVGLAVDAAGRIYVLDGETKSIYLFEREG